MIQCADVIYQAKKTPQVGLSAGDRDDSTQHWVNMDMTYQRPIRVCAVLRS
jgi:hypothetical protein